MPVEDLARELEVGRYVLTIIDPQTRRETSVRFQAGAATTDADQLEPNIFTLSSDKQVYRPNEPIELTAQVPFDGEVLVAFADGDIRRWASGSVRNGIAKIRINAPPEWANKGLYALATVYRSGANGFVSTGPGRALGATHFEVRSDQAGYGVKVERSGNALSGRIAPSDELSFSVCVSDPSGACSNSPPSEAYALAFVVDEGLINLTGHRASSDPERTFYSRKRFGLQLMDNYNRLLLKEGGDRPGRLALSNYTSTRVVSMAVGPVRLERGRTNFKIPKLDLQNGSASIFVVVWSRDYAAAKLDSVQVRGRVVADLDLPGRLFAGDNAVIPLRLDNVDFSHEGEFAIRVSVSGAANRISLASGDASRPASSSLEFRTGLRQSEPKTIYLALDTPPDGSGKVDLQVSVEPIGSSVRLDQPPNQWSMELKPPWLPSVETVNFVVPQQAVNLSRLAEQAVAPNYDSNSVNVTVRFANDPQTLLEASLKPKSERTPPFLDYLIWRGMALLHVDDPGNATAQREEISRTLAEILSLQSPDGSFVPYRTLGDFLPNELGFDEGSDSNTQARRALFRAASALDFILLARKSSYDIPERAIRAARQFVEKQIDATCTLEVLYARLVLIDLGKFDYDRIADLEKCDYKDPVARAAGAAVSTRFGLDEQATVILAALDKPEEMEALLKIKDFRLAMVLAFLRQAKAPAILIQSVADTLLGKGKNRPLSSAAAAWVMRSSDPHPVTGARLAVADLQIAGPLGFLHQSSVGVVESSTIPYQRLRGAPISVSARGNITPRGSLTIEGLLRVPDQTRRVPTGALKRRFFDVETGRELRPGTDPLSIGQRIVILIEGAKNALPTMPLEDGTTAGDSGPVLLTDLLPSAFQIVSDSFYGQNVTRLEGVLGNLKPIGDLRSVATTNDRWIAIIMPASSPNAVRNEADQRSPSVFAADNEPDFRQGYIARVTMAGRFTLPSMSIEATTPPLRTLWAEQTKIEVVLPGSREK